jgi:ribosomal protein S18 acetylase RimI-like enzyme
LSFVIELLNARHNRNSFDCGVESLNRYLQQQATQDIRRNVATVCVACSSESAETAGYYSLANAGVSSSVLPDILQKKMPRYQMLPAVLLGRLATDLRYRGHKLGTRLLLDALAFSLKSPLAWTLFVTEAINDTARAFYEHFGFRQFKDNENHLYLTRGEISKLHTSI